jgi:hypothetical protein
MFFLSMKIGLILEIKINWKKLEQELKKEIK